MKNVIITILKLLIYFLLNKTINKDVIRKINTMDGFKKDKGRISLNKKNG